MGAEVNSLPGVMSAHDVLPVWSWTRFLLVKHETPTSGRSVLLLPESLLPPAPAQFHLPLPAPIEMTRMVMPEHHARQGPAKRRCMRRRQAPSAPPWHSGTTAEATRERACRFVDVKVDQFYSSEMSSTARPRLRSEIGEVRGSLKRITVTEFLAREAAVQGGAGAEPSSSPSTPDAPRGTNDLFSVRDSALHGGSGMGPSSSSSKAPPHGTNGLLLAAAEPRPEVSAAPASKRRKTIPSTEPPASTNHVTFKALHDVPERHNAEPPVLVRASYLKTRYAGLIAKAADALSLRRLEDLERWPAADVDEGSHAREDTQGEMAREALQREEERNARLARLRVMAREALKEVDRKARLTGLSVETIHPVHLMELGITAVEHVVSLERRRDGDVVLPVASVHRRRSPLEELGLFVKSIDGGEQDIESR